MKSRAKELREWRHRTGRSRRRCPKGQPDYDRLAWHHARRNYRSLLRAEWMEDLRQEIALVCHDARRRSAWRKGSGRPKNIVGRRRFVRMVNRTMHEFSRKQGLVKPRGGSYRRLVMTIEVDTCTRGAPPDVLAEIRRLEDLVGATLVRRALDGDHRAIAEIRIALEEEGK